jgi:hypothetical protein
MLQARFFACAEMALRDADTQRVSLIGLIEDLRAAGFPLVVPRIAAYALLARDRGDPDSFPCTLALSLGGVSVGDCPFVLQFTAAPVTRALVHLTDVIIPGPGALRVSLSAADELIAGIEIPIRIVR